MSRPIGRLIPGALLPSVRDAEGDLHGKTDALFTSTDRGGIVDGLCGSGVSLLSEKAEAAFPSVAHPAFSNQAPLDDHYLRERHPGIDRPPPTLCVHHTGFSCAFCHEFVLCHTQRCPDRRGGG